MSEHFNQNKTKQNDNLPNNWGRQNDQYSEQMRVVAGVQRGKAHTTKWWPVLVLHQVDWYVSLSQSRDNNIVFQVTSVFPFLFMYLVIFLSGKDFLIFPQNKWNRL